MISIPSPLISWKMHSHSCYHQKHTDEKNINTGLLLNEFPADRSATWNPFSFNHDRLD